MGRARRRIPAIPIAVGIVFGLVIVGGTMHWATPAGASSIYATGIYAAAVTATQVSYEDDLAAFFAEVDARYPFFELKGIRKDWDAAKKRLMAEVKHCKSDSEFLGIVVKAIRTLRDSHMWISDAKAEIPKSPARYYSGISFLPVTKGRVVVMSPPQGHEKALPTGTPVVAIDGNNPRKVLEERAKKAWEAGGPFSSPQRARLFEYRIPLRGAKGEKHTITVLSKGQRRRIALKSDVEARGWPHTYNLPADLTRVGRSFWHTKLRSGVGYMYLRRVDGSTAGGMAKAFARHPDATGWIVDLRGNGGGSYSPELNEQINAIPRPVAVLIDAGTFSAGETLARDVVARTGARVFGSRTAGSSTAKRTWSFPSGRASIVLSRRSRWRSDRKPIEFNGIEPDEPVEAVPEEVAKGINSAIRRAEEYLVKEYPKHAR